MCGIIGIFSQTPVVNRIVEGLRRLEYRGYDSSGVAVVDAAGAIVCRRAVGKIAQLEARLAQEPVDGVIGIGHTRWATHGAPAEHNAHPLTNGRVCVVHNGIIENFAELRATLRDKGHTFTSETDTETIVHLITNFLDQGYAPEEAFKTALHHLQGAFAIAVLFKDHALLMGARRGSPLVIGVKENETFLGSDALGLAPFTNHIVYLEEGDWVLVHAATFQCFNEAGEKVERSAIHVPTQNLLIAKGAYPHFMLKEIHEQPGVIGDTLASVLDHTNRHPAFDKEKIPVPSSDALLNIVACGTSYYAAMTAKYWIEKWARIRVNVDMASEFRYREPPLFPGGIALFISQSGETADTLAALQYAKAQKQHCIAVVNVAESSMARAADGVIITDAGVEIGVASTKAFTCQLAVLIMLALWWARERGTLEDVAVENIVSALAHLPSQIQDILNQQETIQEVAQCFVKARDILYLGRGVCYPLALEGALKLKELSYIHAEGFPAGEMKHGPIALIDQQVPVVVIAPHDALVDKTLSNAHEVAARGAPVVFVTDVAGKNRVNANEVQFTVCLPTVHPDLVPLLYVIPLQLLAYYTAVLKGTDVDQPRNLAKSVTVE